MATYTDDFNRANGAIGASWANVGGSNFQVVSNEARQQSSGGQYYAGRYASDMDSGNYSVTATVRVTDGASGVGVIGRMTASGTATADIDGYAAFYFPGDRWYLQRLVNGQDSFGGSGVALDDYVGSTTAGTNYTVELRMSGTSIDVYIDSTLRMSATDSGLSSGRAGLLSYGGANSTSAPYYENFTAVDAVTSATGDLAVTLTALVSASVGAVDIAGAAANTLAALASVSAGAVDIGGATSVTLAALTLVSEGTAASSDEEGVLAVTLAAVTVVSAGAVDITGVANVTLATLTVNSAGVAGVTGDASITLAALTVTPVYALQFYDNGQTATGRILIDLDDVVTDPAYDVGASDFSYEFWFRCAYADNTTTATDEDVRYSNIILDRDIWGHARGWCLGVTRSGANLVVCHGIAGNSWTTYFGTTDVGDDAWHFCEYSRSGSTIRVFVDGTQQFSYTYGADLSYPNGETGGGGQFNPYLVIGAEKHGVGYWYEGQFDEFRISDIARHTSSYVLSYARLPVDGDTMALWRFDSNDTVDTFDEVADYPATLNTGGSPVSSQLVVAPQIWVYDTTEAIGDLSVTLTALASSSAGTVLVSGGLAVTMGNVTTSSAGAVLVVGVASVTLDALTVASGGAVDITAVASITLSVLPTSATGYVGAIIVAIITGRVRGAGSSGRVRGVGSTGRVR